MTATMKLYNKTDNVYMILEKPGTVKEIADYFNSMECFFKAFGWERVCD